jgi:hypothetical protein
MINKDAKMAGTEQKIMGNKPVFVKLVNYMEQKVWDYIA